MTEFILEIAMFAGFGTAIFMLARALPRVGDDETQDSPNVLKKFWAKVPARKLDAHFASISENVLHKTRMAVRRFDSAVISLMHKIKRSNLSHEEEAQQLFGTKKGIEDKN